MVIFTAVVIAKGRWSTFRSLRATAPLPHQPPPCHLGASSLSLKSGCCHPTEMVQTFPPAAFFPADGATVDIFLKINLKLCSKLLHVASLFLFSVFSSLCVCPPASPAILFIPFFLAFCLLSTSPFSATHFCCSVYIYMWTGVCVCMYLFTHVRMFVIVMSIGYNVEGRSSVFVVQSTITSFFLFYFIFFRSPIVLFFYCHVHSDQTRKPSRGLFMIPVINYTSGAGLQMSTQRNRQITVTGGESTSQQEFSSLSLHQICMMFIRRNQRRKSQERPIHINKLAEVNPFRRVCVPATILHLLAGRGQAS